MSADASQHYLTNEQRAVVEARKRDGYCCERRPNGFWFCHKGRHRLLINALGYDCFTPIQ